MKPAVIAMRIPAQSRFIGATRVTAANLGSEVGFAVDAIDDLVVGVNELVAMLIEWAEDHGGETVSLSFELASAELLVRVAVDGAGGHEPADEPDVLDDLARRILERVVDDFDLEGPTGWLRKALVTS